MGLFKDTYNITHKGPAYPQTVHEHKAPTDDSVKLLREMEKEAENSVLQHFKFADSNLNGVVVECESTLGGVIHVLFNLNGERHHIKIPKLSEKLLLLDVNSATELLYKNLTEAIAQELMPEVIREAARNFK